MRLDSNFDVAGSRDVDDACVMTVLGPLAADELGVVLPHEHLLIDTTVCYWQEPADGSGVADEHEPVEITKLGLLRRNLFALRDNLVLDDPELAVQELAAFRAFGGGTVVDLTLPDIGRDPLALQEIARRSGVQIVMGCGHYIHLAHPQTLDDEPLEAIAERMMVELTRESARRAFDLGSSAKSALGTRFTATRRKCCGPQREHNGQPASRSRSTSTSRLATATRC